MAISEIKFALNMVDIQSATAENRRGKKIEDRRRRQKKPQDRNIMSACALQGGHNDFFFCYTVLSSV